MAERADAKTSPSDVTTLPDAVKAFVERFAATLATAGFPPMPARVFATLMVCDSGRMTAAELAANLQASAGGISGAVGYLTQLRVVRREREPGTRSHVYAVDSSWYEATVSNNPLLEHGPQDLREGIALLAGSPAAERLAETLELFEFLSAESKAMLDRWHERLAARA
ncbi:MAG: MarR family transcriptional regulator [Propionibacteriaceae bacterium]|jgi:hypothetical protein|nr:MarR family transcriptional regulator [Propionibacteriaceae bacterium]